jgi:sugar (pentulose or hexulose) kinase
MMGEAVNAGLDLGTSGCQGVLVTADGRVCAHRREVPDAAARAGFAE